MYWNRVYLITILHSSAPVVPGLGPGPAAVQDQPTDLARRKTRAHPGVLIALKRTQRNRSVRKLKNALNEIDQYQTIRNHPDNPDIRTSGLDYCRTRMKHPESGIRNQESGIRNQEFGSPGRSGIRNQESGQQPTSNRTT